MDFRYHYTKEQEEFRKEVRDWLKANVPDEMRSRHGGSFQDLPEHVYKFWREKHKVLAAKGWLYPTYPKEYGGGGLSANHETILTEEFERARVVRGFSMGLIIPTLLVWGSEEQKRKFLAPVLKAEKIAFQFFTEPQSGSDLAGIQSRAVRDGDDWVLSGQKCFITGQGDPDVLFGPLVTDPNAPRHRNLGFFIIPFPSKGLEMKRQNLLSGHESCFFFMDNVRIPGGALVGGDHQGWQVAGTTLEIEHGGRGIAFPRDEALSNLIKYSRESNHNGHTIGEDPILQQKAMEALINSRIHTLFSKRNYWMYQARQEMSYHGSQNSMYGKVFRMVNADLARDIMGMNSLLDDRDPRAPFEGKAEAYQRSSLVGAHPGGTVEVQKVIIARRIGISRTRERAAATPSTSGVSGV
ncbi:MAG: acyl-CoA dehydrogenase family protein [Chloroflexi bacterium]|nr:acyl-CoA dehydrogenase family protein [Chloroflexota bacterium]